MHIRIEGWWLPHFTHIRVRVLQPGVAWWRGPAWATLEFPAAGPPKSATDGLRWMVGQLEANLRARKGWPEDLELAEGRQAAMERAAKHGQVA